MATGARAQQPSRPRLLQAVLDAWAQPDVREKLAFVFAMLVVFRFVAHIPIPGVNSSALDNVFNANTNTSAFLGTLNVFSGGALRQLSVAALGVYPYITASIIMQILIPMVPSLTALSKEGEQGRDRIELYTHWISVPMAVVQAYSQLLILNSAGNGQVLSHSVSLSGSAALPTFAAVMSMTAGSMFLVWLGELITEKGIGNGISLIIFAGIVANVPSLIPQITQSNIPFFGLLLLGIIVLVAIVSIVYFQEAQRRIPVQYSRTQFRGGRQYRQQGSTHIPLRVLSAGMIPIIFAYSIMLFPSFLGETLRTSNGSFWHGLGVGLVNVFGQRNVPYYIIVFIFVMLFTFFYTFVTFQQQNLAENLQKQGGFIPGIRPGPPTSQYITRVLVRVTWAGAIFLGLIAVMPYFATTLTNVQALTISGTALLIVVGVVLDTMKQLEAQLMMRNYSGFIR